MNPMMSASMIIRNSWEDTFDEKFKVVMLGDDGVGKTSLRKMLVSKTFNLEETTTIGVDFSKKTVSVDGSRVQLLIFDTSGQKRFLTVTRSYYRGADGFLIMYDSTKSMTDCLSHWLDDVRKHSTIGVPVIVIGTKSDLKDGTRDEAEDTDMLRRRYPEITASLQTSAKENINITEAFTALAKAMMEKKEKEEIKVNSGQPKEEGEEEVDSKGGFQSLMSQFRRFSLKKDPSKESEDPAKSKATTSKTNIRGTETKLERDVRVIGMDMKNMEVNMQMIREELMKVTNLGSTVSSIQEELKTLREEVSKLKNVVEEVKLEAAMIEDVVQSVNIKCNEENWKMQEEIRKLKKYEDQYDTASTDS